ncbi:MAG: DUF512 domain-containing protein, partial [Syntrophorhabdaceae bacterium]|nr:DUF512 domain-containing protein [Syntrophorhabdaceae bacterium]
MKMSNSGGVRVDSVVSGSLAEAAGIRSGDAILSVSGKPIEDMLDLHFLTSANRFQLRWLDASGQKREKTFRASGEPLGIVPEPIRVRRCANRCIFCFVHQLPKGLRPALYIKDEDARLSFLNGQYVTFSDLSEEETRRIIRYRLSPLYVSIHTTSLSLRRRMLGNPNALDILKVIRRLTRAGITLHGQIVVCPGINDGEELVRTLHELSDFRPALRTVAVVPVGLTSHRAGLPRLRAVTAQEARETLNALSPFRMESGGETFVMAADEYYMLAGAKIPGKKAYGSFPQIENGVGLLRIFHDGAKRLFRRKRWPAAPTEGGTVITGMAAAEIASGFLRDFSRRSGASFRMLAARNRLMGESVTVTGLLSGGDILRALGGKRHEVL